MGILQRTLASPEVNNSACSVVNNIFQVNFTLPFLSLSCKI